MEKLVNELYLVKSLIDINLFYSIELKRDKIHLFAHSGGRVLSPLLRFAKFGLNTADGCTYTYSRCVFHLVKFNASNGHVK